MALPLVLANNDLWKRLSAADPDGMVSSKSAKPREEIVPVKETSVANGKSRERVTGAKFAKPGDGEGDECDPGAAEEAGVAAAPAMFRADDKFDCGMTANTSAILAFSSSISLSCFATKP